MSQVSKLALIAIVGSLSLSPAFAQNAPSKSASKSAGSTMAKQRSPQSIACSKQADAKGLHGTERKKFRKSCMKGSGGMGKQDVD
ncbi:MAG: PsiF family protein [Methylovirgula sp.]